jgi:glutamyl-tRNA synthetase
MAKFRTRQAPSPTGYIHIGTARTVLFTDLLSRHYKGEWYLRLEDTDRTRLVADSALNILTSLDSLKLTPKEGITLIDNGRPKDEFYGVYQEGKYGPYIQSERLPIYHEHAQKLIDKKLAYWSIVSDSQKQDLLAVKQASKKAINYFHVAESTTVPELLYMSVEDGLKNSDKPSLRFRLQKQEKIVTKDLLLGASEFDLSLEEDYVLLKNDGYPTYHFAHLIDDKLMETTHIIRSQEWLPSIAKHVASFEAYWGKVPEYLHLPFILGETGNKKMSKRDSIVDLAYFISQGNLPEALINYLAFLGWNPGSEQEMFLSPLEVLETTLDDRLELLKDNISEQFQFEKLSKSPARFSNDKLNWFNKEYIKLLSLNEFATRSQSIKKPEFEIEQLNEWQFASLLLDKQRVSTLAELGLESDCAINYTKPAESDIAWKKLTPAQSKVYLKDIWEQVISPFYKSDAAKSILEDQQLLYEIAKRNTDPNSLIEKFNAISTVFELVIKDWLDTYQKDKGSYLWPLRVALSGKSRSPSPFELLALLPETEVQNRIIQNLL